MKVAFYTFGCKLNQCETEALAAHYRNQGFSINTGLQQSDLFIINTCTVTSRSEQKARRTIRNISRDNPRSLVIVTGCYAQLEKAEIESLGSNIIVILQQDKARLFDFASGIKRNPDFQKETLRIYRELFELTNTGKIAQDQDKQASDPFLFKADKYQFHSRPFCKIQDGCNYHCSYCRVPLARGKSISLDPEIVLKRVMELEKGGYREVVLTGINICAYNYKGFTLVDLLKNILAYISQTRIRLSSLEPEMISEEFAEVLTDKAICPHFHIPIQSGSDKILGLMLRRYKADKVIKAAALLEKAKSGAFFSGDIIVGFPGETDEDFQLTHKLIADLNFPGLHIFSFSPRPGTAACSLKAHVPENIKKERSLCLHKTVNASFARYVLALKGKKLTILLEKRSVINQIPVWQGLSGNYLKVQIEEKEGMNLKQGMLVEAEVTEPSVISGARYLATL